MGQYGANGIRTKRLCICILFSFKGYNHCVINFVFLTGRGSSPWLFRTQRWFRWRRAGCEKLVVVSWWLLQRHSRLGSSQHYLQCLQRWSRSICVRQHLQWYISLKDLSELWSILLYDPMLPSGTGVTMSGSEFGSFKVQMSNIFGGVSVFHCSLKFATFFFIFIWHLDCLQGWTYYSDIQDSFPAGRSKIFFNLTKNKNKQLMIQKKL